MSMADGEVDGTDVSDLLRPFNLDQAAASIALVLGAVGGLLAVIFRSRCLCRCRLGCGDKCYLWDCLREPPKETAADEDDDHSGDEDGKMPPKPGKTTKKRLGRRRGAALGAVEEPPPATLSPPASRLGSPDIERPAQTEPEPEPEPEPEHELELVPPTPRPRGP